MRTKIEGGWHGFDSVVPSTTMVIIVNSDVCKGDIFLNPPEEMKSKINLVPAMTDVIGMAIWTAGGEACTNDKKVLKAARDKLVAAKGAMGLDRQRQL